MKKKSGHTFMEKFLRGCFYFGVLVVIFFISFKVTGIYLEKTSKDADDTIRMERKGRMDSVSFNLLFSLNQTDHTIEHVVLEVLNTKTDCLMYTTIPLNTKLAMSTELYQKMVAKNGDIPQIMTFKSMKEYVKPANYYDFGTELIEDALGVEISYYTIVPSHIFDDIFAKDKDNVLVLSKKVKNTVSHYDESKIISYAEDFYDNTKSNLSKKNKLTYTPALSKVVWDDIIFGKIQGEKDASGYIVDTEKTSQLFDAMKNNYVAEEMKGLVGKAEKVSLEKNIMVYNGSGINGLAGNIKEKLEAEGYQVKGIGNYTSSDVAETVIQVNKEGLGRDLIQYFKTATVELKEDMPYGVDIEIILGKSESAS